MAVTISPNDMRAVVSVMTFIIMVITLANLVSPVYAHADYDRSEPASGTVIREATTRIHV